jgi:hypothetical protein
LTCPTILQIHACSSTLVINMPQPYTSDDSENDSSDSEEVQELSEQEDDTDDWEDKVVTHEGVEYHCHE